MSQGVVSSCAKAILIAAVVLAVVPDASFAARRALVGDLESKAKILGRRMLSEGDLLDNKIETEVLDIVSHEHVPAIGYGYGYGYYGYYGVYGIYGIYNPMSATHGEDGRELIEIVEDMMADEVEGGSRRSAIEVSHADYDYSDLELVERDITLESEFYDYEKFELPGFYAVYSGRAFGTYYGTVPGYIGYYGFTHKSEFTFDEALARVDELLNEEVVAEAKADLEDNIKKGVFKKVPK